MYETSGHIVLKSIENDTCCLLCNSARTAGMEGRWRMDGEEGGSEVGIEGESGTERTKEGGRAARRRKEETVDPSSKDEE